MVEPENFNFLHRNVPEKHILRPLSEAVPGSAWYIPLDAVVVDQNRVAWIDKTQPQAMIHISIYDQEKKTEYVRAIFMEDPSDDNKQIVVLDISPFEITDVPYRFGITEIILDEEEVEEHA